MKTLDEQRDQLWDYLIDNEIASLDTLQVVTNINGYTLDTLEDILYATTGYKSLKQIEGKGNYKTELKLSKEVIHEN